MAHDGNGSVAAEQNPASAIPASYLTNKVFAATAIRGRSDEVSGVVQAGEFLTEEGPTEAPLVRRADSSVPRRSLAEPHTPQQAVAPNEMMIKCGADVKYEQDKQKPCSDAVRQTRRILREVRQQLACSAKDRWRRAAQRHHPHAACNHPKNDDVEQDMHRLRGTLLPARRSGNRVRFMIEPPPPDDPKKR